MRVRVDKAQLQETLRINRDAHEADFNEVWELYRQKLIDALQELIDEAKAAEHGKKNLTYSAYVHTPENHTKDYDRIIDMVAMDNSDSIELSEQDYSWYVLDNWDWKERYNLTSSSLKGEI